jgi:hypothetical protein
MRTIPVNVRITRKKKCKEGFYLVFNGQRIHFKFKGGAVSALNSLLGMQKFQIVTVREYAARHRKKKPEPVTLESDVEG